MGNHLKLDKQLFIKDQIDNISRIIGDNFSESTIDELARRTGFIRRSRKLSASHFLNALMFSRETQAQTSLPGIVSDLEEQFSVDISKEGLHKKFNSNAVAFIKALIQLQLSRQSMPQAETLGRYFNAINIKDSTKFLLPVTYNGEYPGFGNFSQRQGVMNIQYEYDILSGNWKTIELTTIKRNDQLDSTLSVDSIAKNELYIRDLGYVTPTYLKAIISKGAYFLNRLPPQAAAYSKKDNRKINWLGLEQTFRKIGIDALDMEVIVYQNDPICCRMVVERVNDAVYRERIKKAKDSAVRHGVGITKEHKARCRYNMFITNVGRDVLPIKKVRQVYHLRWQIEIMFKTWKSTVQINKIKKVKKERFECHLLAKLLWTILNWKLFQCCSKQLRTQGDTTGISVIKFFKRCIALSGSLRLVVLGRLSTIQWLIQSFLPMIRNTACEAPARKKTHFHTLALLS